MNLCMFSLFILFIAKGYVVAVPFCAGTHERLYNNESADCLDMKYDHIGS